MSGAVVAFDVNETLLDVAPIARAIEELSDGDVAGGEWFARLLHASLLANELALYRPFGDLGRATLEWLLERAGRTTAPEALDQVMAMMTSLPPHPDVIEGLERLRSDGARMIALTNGAQAAAETQIQSARLGDYFEAVLSVESVERFKPDRAVYSFAASACGVSISDLVLVAAHDWDVAGAQRAGATGIFVARQPWGIAGVEPMMRVDDVGRVAEALRRL